MLRDVLGPRAADDLVDELQILYQQIATLGWKEMRPWSEFFASFKPPQFNSKHLEQRVTTNFLHYRTNYVMVAAGILVVQILFSPMIILSTAMIFCLYAYLTHVHKGSFQIGDFILNAKGKQYLFFGLSAVILISSGTLFKLFWTVFYSIFLCGGHMVMRPRSVSSKANRMYEEMKLSGENIFDFIPTTLYTDAPSSGSTREGTSSRRAADLEDPESKNEAYAEFKGADSKESMRKRPASYSSSKGD